jgi:hypothetical protein
MPGLRPQIAWNSYRYDRGTGEVALGAEIK